jgi:hypothetical protein
MAPPRQRRRGAKEIEAELERLAKIADSGLHPLFEDFVLEEAKRALARKSSVVRGRLALAVLSAFLVFQKLSQTPDFFDLEQYGEPARRGRPERHELRALALLMQEALLEMFGDGKNSTAADQIEVLCDHTELVNPDWWSPLTRDQRRAAIFGILQRKREKLKDRRSRDNFVRF